MKKFYLKKYSLPSSIDAIKHYLTIGYKKGYNPNNEFDTSWYLKENPDVLKSDINPFVHYLKFGVYEGRIPKMLYLDEVYQQNLKLTLRGRKGWLFLINDSNNEIKQHFDFNFTNLFNKNEFISNLFFKKNLFNNNGMDYFFFVVPDKSVVCEKFLPFHHKNIKRNVSTVPNFRDFSKKLNPSHYFKYDSHLNYEGGKLLTFFLLSVLDSKINTEVYDKLIKEGRRISINRIYDLLADINWSYDVKERVFMHTSGFETTLCPKDLVVLDSKIPNQFKKCGKRDSHYFFNKNSFSNKRAIIFHDSSIESLQWYLTFYFREIFLYWDHGLVNKELINYFQPDIVLEIRIERFLDNMVTPSWVINQEVL